VISFLLFCIFFIAYLLLSLFIFVKKPFRQKPKEFKE
jgi:hypothetical protein